MTSPQLGSIRFIPRMDRSVELRGCDWAPVSTAEHGRTMLCRNAAGWVFIATKRDGSWLDQDGLERDPVDYLMGIK